MLIFTCSNCGNPVEFPDNVSHTQCRYCGAEHSLAVPQEAPSAESLIRDAKQFLEEGSFDQAMQLFLQAQAIAPTDPQVHLGLLLADLKVQKEEALADQPMPFDALTHYKNAVTYADPPLQTRLFGYIEHIRQRNQQQRYTDLYSRAKTVMASANTEEAFRNAAELLERIPEYEDAESLRQQCLQQAEQLRMAKIEALRAQIYTSAAAQMAAAATPQDFRNAGVQFSRLPGYRDADRKARECAQRAQYLHLQGAVPQAVPAPVPQAAPAMPPLESVPQPASPAVYAPPAVQPKKKKTLFGLIAAAVLLVLVVAGGAALWFGYFQPMLARQAIHQRINEALVLMEQGNYEAAYPVLEELGETEAVREDKLRRAQQLLGQERYEEAYTLLIEAGDHETVKTSKRRRADAHLALEEYDKAYTLYGEIGDLQAIVESKRQRAENYLLQEDYESAAILFEEIGDRSGLDRICQAEAMAFFLAGDTEAGFQRLSLIEDSQYTAAAAQAYIQTLFTEGKRQQAYDFLLQVVDLLPWQDIQNLWTNFSPFQVMDGLVTIAFIYEDGTCGIASGDGVTDPGWTDIVSVASGGGFTLGLKSDGTVVGYFTDTSASSSTANIQQAIGSWNGVVAVHASANYAVALRYDGSVLLSSLSAAYIDLEEVNQWTGLVAVDVGESHAIGLKADGTLIYAGDRTYGKCKVSGWKDVVAISVTAERTVGLKADGTVLQTGQFSERNTGVRKWSDIVFISAGYWHTVGLTENGEILGVSHQPDSYGEISFYSDAWTDIVYVVSGSYYTVGLRSDGTLVSTGDNVQDPFNASAISGVRVP